MSGRGRGAMSEDDPASASRLQRTLRWHAVAYAVVIGTLTAANIVVGDGWWAYWPTIVWGIALAIHFFYVRASSVDEKWIEERSGDLRLRSYDLGHIEDIKKRVAERDQSVRPSDERGE